MLVPTKAQFDQFVELFNGHAPCFTSHNAHPSKDVVTHRYIPFDFDGKDKLENTLADVLQLRDWARNQDLASIHVFTGGRGFHSYLAFKPAALANDTGLKGVYKALQRKAIEEARLRTADRGIVGDVRRILRIVGCAYMSTKDGKKSGYYTTEIPDEMLDGASIQEIAEWSREPRPMAPEPAPRETLHDAIQRLDLRWEATQRADATTPTIEYKNSSPELVKALLPRPCVHQGIMTHNPAHIIRFEAARHLLQIGMGVAGASSFLLDVAEQASWVDRSEAKTRYYVDNISKQSYSPVSCLKIRASGLCVGEACERFRREFPDENRG